MKRRVVVLPPAEDDLDAGQQFYEQEAPGLGEYFIDCLAVDIEALSGTAGVHRKIHGLHRCVCKRFPYAIFYKTERDAVAVYAVLDCRRDPDELHARLFGRQ